jgi:hypothetical protein
MFDYHGFFIAFWTTLGLLLAGFYIMICCGEDIYKAFNRFGDTCNDYIDSMSGATAEKMPTPNSIIIDV